MPTRLATAPRHKLGRIALLIVSILNPLVVSTSEMSETIYHRESIAQIDECVKSEEYWNNRGAPAELSGGVGVFPTTTVV